MRIQLHYTVEIRDKEGKLLKRQRRKAHSFLQQYNELISYLMTNVDRSVKDTGGTDRTLDRNAPSSIWTLASFGTEAQDVEGVVIGTGATAVAIDDHALETQIAHGVGSGQMYYYAVTISTPSVNGSECSFTLTRVIGNQSGATITVKEIGIYSRAYYTAYSYHCIVRDVLTTTQDVPDGGSITVVYTIKVTV